MSNGKFNKIGVISARCLCENIARLTNIKGTKQTPPLLHRVSICSIPCRTWNVQRGIVTRSRSKWTQSSQKAVLIMETVPHFYETLCILHKSLLHCTCAS